MNTKEEQDRKTEQMDYPASEDIFNRETPVSLEETGKIQKEEMDMNLDVPGSAADDEMQDVGSEDEENNYWSLGGDRHDD